MSDKFTAYKGLDYPLPRQTWAWNMYGAGVENIGRDGQPEIFDIPEPGADQLLVRVDTVGMCYSDVKLIKQGGSHPKLYNRDLAQEPTRLGHEAALTIIKVGANLADQYAAGQRLAVQPDIYQDGRSTAYGYTIPGGLIQYHVMGPEVLAADDGAYVLSAVESLGYAEIALTEPWACVEASYTQRRRLSPKSGGTLWLAGDKADATPYTFSSGLDAPALIILTDAPEAVRKLAFEQQARGARVVEANGLTSADLPAFKAQWTGDAGFDDIVLLNPRSADWVAEAAKLIAFRGTCNLVGTAPLDGKPQIDVGRLHYHYTAYVGNPGPEIAASYGETRNRCDLQPGGVAVFVGAGGPMGQMHVQRAIELPSGPSHIIATEVNDFRLQELADRFAPLATAQGKTLHAINPMAEGASLPDLVQRLSDGVGADDVVVSVPVGPLMAASAELLAPDGMLVLFAGVPNGTYAPLDLSQVYLHNMQFTGTSGSGLADQQSVLDKAVSGELSPNRSVAAVGGLEAARDGVEAMMAGTYAGKVVIFPQISGLPLMSLEELAAEFPDIGAALDDGYTWSPAAERALIARFWQPA